MKKILLSCFLLFAFFFSNAQKQTKLNPALCGTVLKTSTGEIDAGAVSPAATAYRFVITHGGIIDTLESASAFAQLGNLPDYTYNTTYSVGVVIMVDGVWGNLSRTSCVVTSSAPFTQLALNVCGTTLDLDGDIHADGAPLATAYRFRVTHGSTVETLDSPTREAKLSDLPDYLYNTTYTIDVAIMVNGTWSAYGVACNVTTPVLATNVSPQFCGTVLTTNDGQITTEDVPGATAYRFRATNGSHIDSVDSQISFARLGDMPSYDYNTTYSVQVTAKVNGVWLPYGPACNVTSPVLVPQISSVQCGTVLTTADGEIHEDLILATAFRFKITQGALVDSLQSTSGSVVLSALSFYAYNTTYSVQVAVERNGIWTAYGPACNVTTIAASTNANLSALTLSTGTLNPVFNPATLAYTATVSNTTTTIKLSPTVADATATVKVNGTAVTSGSPSGNITLNPGANTITTLVTAQDGTTTKSYTLTATRTPVLTITASAQTKVYGSVNPTLTYTYSGFVNGDTTSIVTTPPVISTLAVKGSVIGNYPITLSGAVVPGYDVVYVSAVLTVTPLDPPTITSFSPASGPIGTSVTITGTNFNTTPASNIVFFGATMATVSAATATSLTVTVPAGASYQPISVLNGSTALTGYSASPFITTFTPNKGSLAVPDMATKVDFATGSGPICVVISDIDGDGKPDLVVTNSGINTVSVYRNTSVSGTIGTASFAAKVDFATGSVPTQLAIGDLDGDGKPDIVTTNYSGNTISILRNTSTSGSITTASFAANVDLATVTGPRGIAIGDIDGDGKPELVVTNTVNSNWSISIFHNISTSGSLTAASFDTKVDYPAGREPFCVAIGDIDGDGKPDLVTGNNSGNTVSVFRNTSTRGSISTTSFAPFVDITATASNSGCRGVAFGDLDGDGKLDLVVANAGGRSITILRNTATSGSITTASFAPMVEIVVGNTTILPSFVVIGDIDGDGKPDVAWANYNSAVCVLRNISTSGSLTAASFAPKVDFPTGSMPNGIAIGDLDGDGKTDLVASNYTSNTISVLRNMPVLGATNVTFTNTTVSTTTASWTNGTGVARAVFMAPVSTGTPLPTDNITYTGNAAFGSGTQEPNGWYCVYNGTDTTVNITGLAGGTTYRLMTVEYNGATGSQKYLTTAGTNNPANATTAPGPVINVQPSTASQTLCIATAPTALTVSAAGAGLTYQWYQNTTNSNSGGTPVSTAIGQKYQGGIIAYILQPTDPGYDPSATKGLIAATVDQSIAATFFPRTTTSITLGTVLGTGSANTTKIIGTSGNTAATAASIARAYAGGGFNDWYLPSKDELNLLYLNIGKGASGGNQNIGNFASNDYWSSSQVATATGWKESFTNGTAVADTKTVTHYVRAVRSFSIPNPGLVPLTNTAGTSYYYVVVSATNGLSLTSDVSGAVTVVSVTPSVSIAALPGTVIAANTSVTFTATPTNGGSPPAYQWFKNNNAVGINSATYTDAGLITGDVITCTLTSNADCATTATAVSNTLTIAVSTISTTNNINKVSSTYGTASANTSFNAGGTNLTADITITAPNGYEVSTSTNSNFSNSIILPQTGGIVPTTVIYLRLAANVAAGAYSGNVTLTTGATEVDLATIESTVAQAALTVTADNQTKAYGATLPTLTASYTGFVNNDDTTSLTTKPTLVTTATAASSVAGSPYSITASGAVNSNYTISYVAGTLSVTAAPLTITADNQTKAYGATLPTLTASYTGFVNNDDTTSLTTKPTLVTTATAASSVAGSPYSITASGAVNSNYTISYVAGTLSVTAAPLTITADNQTKAYGAALPTLTASYTGFVNNDDTTSLTTKPTLVTTATASSSVAGSPYSITASGAINSNYTISYVAGTLSVTAAPLTITADNQTKAYGAALPTLTASYTGFVNNDDTTSLTTKPTLVTTATASSSVADSPYSITASGAINSNYTISYVAGTLSVTAAPLTITADNQTKAYGAALPTLTASYTGFVNNDDTTSLTTKPTLVTTATAASSVAGSPYSITASGAINSNYTISYVAGTLSVTAAPLTITAGNQTKTYGAALPTLTASYTGFVNNDDTTSLTTKPTLVTTATASSSVAGSPYSITASGAINSNYTISYVAGTLSVTAAPLTITAGNQTKTYGAALPTLTASYTGFVNNDDATSLTTQPTLVTTATASSSVAGSPYSITASGAVNDNYTISYVAGSLTINKVALTITATNATKTYGQTLTGAAGSTAYSISSGALQNDNTISSITVAYGTGAAATDAATTYTGQVTPSTATGANGFATDNYTITYVNGDIVVNKASLTVSALGISKIYDGNATATVTLSDNRVNSDTYTTTYVAAFNDKNVGTGKPVNVTGIAINGGASANYTLAGTTASTSADVTVATATVTAQADTKVYNKTTASAGVPVVTGLISPDAVGTAATQTFDNSNAGTGKTLTPSGLIINDGNSGNNYTINYVNDVTGAITVATATVTAQTDSKTYNKTTASVGAPVITGLISPDAVSTAATQAFDNSNVGTGKTLTASGLVINDGNSGGNYSINYVTNTTGVITTATATVTAQADSKTYNKTTASAGVPVVTGLISPDAVSTAAIQTFDNANTGTGKTLTPSGLIINDGNSGNNYAINYVNNVTGAITVATATVTAQTDNKVYNKTAASAAVPVITGLISPDAVSTAATQAFDNSNVGTGKTLTPSGLVINDGNGGNNYSISYVNNATGIITTKALTVTAQTDNKVYDATTSSSVSPVTGTLVSGDAILTSPTQTFDTKAVGTGKTLTASGLIINDGNGGNNYVVSYINNTSGVITSATLTYTANAVSRAFGAADPVFTGTITGFAGSDSQLSATTGTASFTTPATTASGVGSYAITGTGLTAANYNIVQAAANNTAFTITPATLTITANDVNKVPGNILTGGAGSTAFTQSGLVGSDAINTVTINYGSGAAAGDAPGAYANSVTPSAAIGTFIPANYNINYVKGSILIGTSTIVATGTLSPVNTTYGTASGNTSFTVSGSNLSNNVTVTAPAGFEVSATAGSGFSNSITITQSGGTLGSATVYVRLSATANANTYTGNVVLSSMGAVSVNMATVASVVAQRVLTVSATGTNKTYDGNTATTVTLSDDRLSGDVFTTAYTTAAFSDKNAGTGKTVNVSGISISGGVSANYTVNTTVATTANIAIATVTVTARADSKTYDKTTASSIAPLVTGLLGTDAIGTAPTQIFNNANAGTGKTLTVSGLVINDGNNGNNYTINYVSNATSIITAAIATVTAQADTKIYDKTTASAAVPLVTGLMGGDVASTNAIQTFNTANVGIGKTLTASGLVINDGNSGNNYTINYIAGTGTITVATATVTAQTDTKIYDKTTVSGLVPVVAGLVSGDVVTTNATQTFNTVNTGTGKTLTPSGLIINDGNNGSNYTINYIVNTAGVITQAIATVTAQPDTRIYDKTTASAIVPLVTGLMTGDVAVAIPTQVFNTANAGTGKTLIPSGLTITDGNAGNNYTINYVNNTAGIITAKGLTVTAQTDSRIYNATTTSSVIPITGALITGDVIATAPTQSFDTKDVGTGKTLTPSGLVITDGNGGNNYAVTYVPNTTGVITTSVLTYTATPVSKVYGATVPTLTGTVSGFVGTDNLASATIGSVSFASNATALSNVGGYAITGSGVSATNGNYTFAQAAANSTALTVTQATLTITAVNAAKAYLQANPALTVTYNGFAGTDNAASLTTQPAVTTTATVNSVPGNYSITASGATSVNYTMNYVAGTLTVLPATNANLSSLAISTGILSPAFATATTGYTVTVANTVTSITITPTVADATATVMVNGNTVTSGSVSTAIPLTVGANTITTVVTAQDGTTKITYTITVNRAPSSNANLSFITLSDGSLSPIFATGTTAYTATVGNNVTGITLTPTPANATATITVNGIAVANGAASASIALNVGDNTITTVVTAQDGTTQITYTVIVHRGAAPDAITATNIMSPNGDGVNDTWVIKDILLYPNNTVTVYDRGGRIVFTKHGYTNDWTATINGAPLTEDTYYYAVDLGVGTAPIRGFITVIRPRK